MFCSISNKIITFAAYTITIKIKIAKMKEINYKEMQFNPFNLIGNDWMLVTAGNQQSGCNTMTISWGHLGCLWGHNDPTAVIYIRQSRYTKQFVDAEPYFTLSVLDGSFKKQLAYLGSTSGRDEDKIAKAGLTPVYADNTVYFQEAKLVLVCKKMYAQELSKDGFCYQETLDQCYPQGDFHTMYVGKIEKIFVDE
jgi:flavin reductase (DIM6/NTAB) family NADH-FMN oxidoreductase RutF